MPSAKYIKTGILSLLVLWIVFLLYLGFQLVKTAKKRAVIAQRGHDVMQITGWQMNGKRITVPLFRGDSARFTGVAFVSLHCDACENLLQSLLETRFDTGFIRMLIIVQDGIVAEQLRCQKVFQARQPAILFLTDSAGLCFSQAGLRAVPVFRLYDGIKKRLVREFEGDINLPAILTQTSKQSTEK